MKAVLTITFFALTVPIFICMILAFKKKERYSRVVGVLLLSGLITMLSYCFSILLPDEFFAYLFNSLYFLSLDWLLLAFLGFTITFTERDLRQNNRKFEKYMKILCYGLSSIDSVSLWVSVFTKHAYTIESVYKNGKFYCWNFSFKLPYTIHLCLCYIFVIMIVFELLYTCLKIPKYLRKNILQLLNVFMLVIVVDCFFVFFRTDFDYSVIFYAAIAVTVYHFTFILFPVDNRRRMIAVVSDNSSSGVVCFDVDGKCIYQNKIARNLFEKNVNTFSNPSDYLKKSWLGTFFNAEQNSVKGEDVFIFDGENHWIEEELVRLYDKKNKFIGCYLKLDDRTEEVNRLNEQKYKASHDLLTGLYNRNAFFEKAAEIINSAPETPRYLIATNIKNFKLINDFFGTSTGDRILREQAKMLSLANYNECICGRISCDKFAMLIRKDDFNPQLAIQNTEKIQNVTKGVNYKLHIYLGVYEIANPKESVRLMYDKALMAIEDIHGDYEQTINFYDTYLMEHLLEEKNIVSEFNRALAMNEFCIYLQPQISKDGTCTGAEALARWKHPKRGLLMPKYFISILEKTGFIYKLDEYVWRQAAEKLREWKQAGFENYTLSVNISTKDFYYTDLYRVFTSLIKEFDISPSQLNLEITETALMHDLNSHIDLLNRLKAFGFKIEIDDFGSGYSSINMLKDLNMDVLKIDMGFLQRTENEERSRIILNSIIAMATELGIQVITEGVETSEQVNFLFEKGCSMFQGFYFSKPVSVEEFETTFMRKK